MQEGMLERVFHLRENGTTARTEIMAGVTTFMTMAYILAVNPAILSVTGMDKGALLTVTALASCFATLLMAAFANYPFALSAGMGLNAYFAFTVVKQMGYSWEMALAAVFVEGIIFIVMSLTNIRQAIFNTIPLSMKQAVSVGIGLFIALIGLFNAHVIVANPATKIALFSFKQSLLTGTFHSVGITVVLSVIGILFTGVLMAKNVKGNILWGILFTWLLGVVCELTGLYVPDPKAGMFSVLPNLSAGLASFLPADPSPIFLKLDLSRAFSLDFAVVVLAFLFVDLFDTLGTLYGACARGNMLTPEGEVPNMDKAMLADAIATTAGAICGTSTVTTFVESASGVAEGGRTGMSAMVTAALFFVAMFLSPIAQLVPSCATAAALVYVGVLMIACVKDIDWHDANEAVPAFLTMAMMPFTYNISYGIAFGLISCIVMKACTGKAREIKAGTWVIAALFLAMLFLTH